MACSSANVSFYVSTFGEVIAAYSVKYIKTINAGIMSTIQCAKYLRWQVF
jgi:hypothetical protein